MKYVAALLLAQLGGNETPAAADIKKILSSVGIESDESRISALLEEVSGKSVEELINAGSSKLASMPAGGAAAAAPAAGGAAAPAAAAAAAAPAKKEESEEEEMGFGLFD
ncbi:60S acidic ribosomal protein P2 [Paramicrosporidium saccamoebae]|uniref:60S acidic ribosomal protein P2 n=1 Tax=Paramicrosporidium saccamoebae TaxID=1246581 RepID=A0A2H9TGN6_9FUNG|nr:60S acidic ribosomal protein P2 [Paramicrosporidium saccamoebae]